MLEWVDLKVVRVVIHSAEVVMIFKVKYVTTNCFPGAAKDLVRDEWFFWLLFLVGCTDCTLVHNL